MTEEEKADLKVQIDEKVEVLEKHIAELKELTKPMGLDNAIGRVSRMDYINNKSVNEAGLRKAETDLKALRRWQELYGTEKFGKCMRCGDPIRRERLIFMPQSVFCIRCASR